VIHLRGVLHDPARSLKDGGLMSMEPNSHGVTTLWALTLAGFSKGQKPSDLPVAASAEVELAVNLKTAKALGLTIPETLKATADKLIE
jgi:putative tryptophan/tyrosine transport system substrate-binding protein